MKKTLFFLIVLGMLAATKALAYEWTDGNGVTWKFSQGKYTINGAEQQLWAITGVSGNSENVVFPEIVYNGATAYDVEAIANTEVFANESQVTSVTLPATIKYIGYNALNFYAGTVTMKSSTPPVLGVYDNLWSKSPNFGAGVTILVPDGSLNTYRSANVWDNYAVRIISQSAKTSYDINATAQANGSGIHSVIGEDNLGNVMTLKVKGTINSYDIMIMRNKMHNLHNLDLTDASVVANSYPYYKDYHTTANTIGDYAFYEQQKLMTVKLPKTITAIGKRAFSGTCYGLRSVEFQDGLETIGEYAFEGCYSLQSVSTKKGLKSISQCVFHSCASLNSVKIEECMTIGSDAFRSCNNLVSVSLPEGLQTIGSYAFNGCKSLPSLTIPRGVVTIGSYAFSSCTNLSTIVFPPTLKTIGSDAFYGCYSLKTISLPTSLVNIGTDTFRDCTSLAELHIPASIKVVGEKAFSGCTSLKDIYTYTVEPTNINQYTFSCWTIATLHIPYFAKNNYYWDTQWSQFAFLTEFGKDYKYDYFYINNDFTFNNESGLVQGVPDAELNAGSGLIVETKGETLQLDEVRMASNATASASIMANNNLSVKKLYFDIEVAKNKWYFLTFPFRVKLSNVTSPGDFVFRYYDGATRATSGKGGWKNVTTDYLMPGQGYIFQTNTDGTLTLQVEKADMDFSGTGKQDALSTYAAENTANASWNFLGNPHTAYFDINQTGYTAPITVWTGSAYKAIRPGDDTYYMKPFEAFFVQKPGNTSAVNFPAAGRYTYKQMQEQTSAARSISQAGTNRYIVNLTIATGDGVEADQTRVVYNEGKAQSYEIDCDAAKFFSDGQAAQLYTLDANGTQYAINERPMGEVGIGYTAGTEGLLTISAIRMDYPVLLHDTMTGITHDLSQGGYTFQTEAGTFDNRFTLTSDGSTTGINSAQKTDDSKSANGEYYDLQGHRTGASTSSKGVRIVKDGHKVTKIMSK